MGNLSLAIVIKKKWTKIIFDKNILLKFPRYFAKNCKIRQNIKHNVSTILQDTGINKICKSL